MFDEYVIQSQAVTWTGMDIPLSFGSDSCLTVRSILSEEVILFYHDACHGQKFVTACFRILFMRSIICPGESNCHRSSVIL